MAKRKTDIRPPSKKALSDLEILSMEVNGETVEDIPAKLVETKDLAKKGKSRKKTESRESEKRPRAMYYCDSKHLMNLKIHAAIEGVSVAALMKSVLSDYMQKNKNKLSDIID